MTIRRAAALLFTVAAACVIVFQLLLALGAPWGEYAMGGAVPGRYPPGMRVAAAVQGVLVGLLSAVVLARAGVAFTRWSQASARLIWAVVAVSAATLLLNIITPSTGERALWAPVAFVLLGSSLTVALSKR